VKNTLATAKTNILKIIDKINGTKVTGKLIGYIQISTEDQNLDLQFNSLIKAGCIEKNIFIDKVSGVKSARPGFIACMETLKSNDTLLVWRLDQLGKSMPELVSIIELLKEKNIGFKSICDDGIDTTTTSAELIFNIFSSLSKFEKRIIQERTKTGLDRAKLRGKKGGRPSVNPNNKKVVLAKKMHQDETLSIDNICQALKISRSTFYRYLEVI
jgi:DNA invertase Pin-like site-specific DNA recombinase